MRLSTVVLIVCGLAAGGAVPAAADTYTYTYTGQNYQFAAGAYTTSERITGEVTLAAPLGVNVVFNSASPPPVQVLSYSFSDGVQTLTNASPGLTTTAFDFGTNAAGLPTQWYLALDQTELYGEVYEFGVLRQLYGLNQIETVNETAPYYFFQQDYVYNGYSPRGGSGWLGENQDAPGTWSMTINATPGVPGASAPEPGSLGLVATSVLGLARWVRRRV